MCRKVRMVKTTVFFTCGQLFGAQIHQFYYSDLNLFLFIMPGVNYLMYGCSTPGVSLYRSLTLKENMVAVITEDRVTDNSLKRQTKNQTLCTCTLFALT